MRTTARPKSGTSALRDSRSGRTPQVQVSPPAPDPSPPRFARVLIPMDLSPKSHRGLRYAMQLPPTMAGRIWLIYVQPSDSFLSGVDTNPLVQSNEAACQSEQHVLEKILRKEVPPSRRGGTRVRIGSPDHEIVKAARELDINLIIMTTHGYHGLRHLLHPSVSERVVRNAPCPVLTVNRAMLTRKRRGL